MLKFTSILALATTATALAQGITQANFTGTGTIHVWNSSDWRDSTPADKVGCLDASGKFINPLNDSACAVFTRISAYPYTLSAEGGNCTFSDESQEKNTDSIYGKSDHAWNCFKPFTAGIYDELYTIDGFSHVFLCQGDVDCYFDAKSIPSPKSSSNIWPFRWGSQQMGITPGHVMLQLVWNKIADLPKGEDSEKIPSPRVSLMKGGGEQEQARLVGKKILG
ncbi:uncharacterized protein N0V89_010155 [Didymosphaeria variabile]|uniref:Uncharacterized protein n=1 Tax=Didymosphaeria variabile TaxID=1932322 RepID=A0A9W9C798_9PLEO|nr:uncharacterized protein N0V89_010155 [Didymosphaeria variabile]KAJ4348777.1 hypothetical protein N0V89_010155 [Didymosphaeria variabile]